MTQRSTAATAAALGLAAFWDQTRVAVIADKLWLGNTWSRRLSRHLRRA